MAKYIQEYPTSISFMILSFACVNGSKGLFDRHEDE